MVKRSKKTQWWRSGLTNGKDRSGRVGTALLLWALVICGLWAGEAVAQTLPALPAIDGERFEPEVRAQVEAAERAVRQSPLDPAVNGRLGMVLQAYEQYELARPCYERARQLAPKEFRWAYLLGMVRAELGEEPGAAMTLREALALDGTSLAAQLRLAESLFAAGQWDESAVHYQQLIQRNPPLPQAHYGLGRVATTRRDLAVAATHYQRAIDLFPGYGAALYALGVVKRQLGQREEAKELLRRAQPLQRSQPPLDDPVLREVAELNLGAQQHLRRGITHEAAGRLDDSITEHERALALNPGLVQAHLNLISIYGRTGEPSKAEVHYRAALAQHPNLPELHYNYGVLLVSLNRIGEAKTAFQRSLEIKPTYAEAHHNYAVLIEREGRLEEAAAHYRRAIESKPGYRSAHFLLGRILVNLDRPREAIAEFERSLEPEDAETATYAYALGATYARLGERGRATDYLQRAHRLATIHRLSPLATRIERDLQILMRQ
ncbi:MAG: tetratricopeptide repeat protein [Blastocatellia bacterium]|jgi:tetratricopeptide (TPR) repeat protein